jgi:hypothetical protein
MALASFEFSEWYLLLCFLGVMTLVNSSEWDLLLGFSGAFTSIDSSEWDLLLDFIELFNVVRSSCSVDSIQKPSSLEETSFL